MSQIFEDKLLNVLNRRLSEYRERQSKAFGYAYEELRVRIEELELIKNWAILNQE